MCVLNFVPFVGDAGVTVLECVFPAHFHRRKGCSRTAGYRSTIASVNGRRITMWTPD